ncbi:uncharacterized protein F4822DRAFT_424759 [Hypoxylon trugodes]|uniref:uncharacterized protein n=1 Tax=Hypoxylon trugodes TaxID=326681 RepID=UPI0021962193|nr:uncharacterized protein F4822DRAFT_424759 [Hypoxylon trugodes]KAI1394280.1 hypothetical protein F4822DRAFT_424759 [Hypoxylon trugodes]
METTDTTVDAPNRNDEEVVIVNLVSHPQGLEIPTIPRRQFLLSNRTPVVRIGRASKVPTKGFVAAADNAWFDSPVMSRQHAELFLASENDSKVVFIKDIGSLHGTYYTPYDGMRNESRLEQGKPVQLSNGDTIRFGVDIFRTSETYPPCSVEFYMTGPEPPSYVRRFPGLTGLISDDRHISSIDQSTNRVFTVPDDDDDEEDEDDDSVVETTIPISHIADIQRGASIDLTQDERDSVNGNHYPSSATVGNVVSSDVIDLTSEPGEHSDPEPDRVRTRHSSVSLPETVQPVPAPATILAASGSDIPAEAAPSQKSMGFSGERDHSWAQDLDPHLYEDDIRLSDSDDESVNTRNSDMDDDAGEESEDVDEDEDRSIDYGLDSSPFNSDSEEEDAGELPFYAIPYWQKINEGDLVVGIDDLPYPDDASSSSDEVEDILSGSNSPAPESSLYSSPNELNPPTLNGLCKDTPSETSDLKRPFVTPFLFTAPLQYDTPAIQAQPRDPSPSDAAMFKSCPVLDRSPSDSRAQALGEKSGKWEFFAARESNRTSLTQFSPPPISAIRETLSDNPEKPVAHDEANHHSDVDMHRPQVEDVSMAPAEETTQNTSAAPGNSDNMHDNAPTDVQDNASVADSTWHPIPAPPCEPWSASGERFINNPRSEDLPSAFFDRAQSPGFDMTSAYSYQQSKTTTESTVGQQPKQVRIEDLLTRESCAMPPPMVVHFSQAPPSDEGIPSPDKARAKRSFMDAFSDENAPTGRDDVVEESKPNSVDKYQHASTVNSESNGTPHPKTQQLGHMESRPASIPTRPYDFQPSKRRRFAQAAACVALGGAAAFTFMVSTAPVL